MLLWGAFAFLAVLVPADLALAVGRRLAAVRVVALALAVATTVVALPVETATVADGWADAVNPGTVGAVLVETSVGTAWAVQAAAAVLLLLAAARPHRWRGGATAASAGLLLATQALTGHAAMQEGWAGVAHRINAAAHVLAAGAWLGSLVPLLVLVTLNRPSARGEAGVALRRFSTAGHAAVAVVLATGVLHTAMTLGRWPTDWASPYQALLAAKIAVVTVMVILAVANRYGVVPRLKTSRGPALTALRAAIAAEIVLGLGALACVSVLGLLDPA